MPKYLVNEVEAKALRDLLAEGKKPSQRLQTDNKLRIPGNMPFRFKLLESMGATTANKANATIFFLGGSTADKIENDFVVDDSSQYGKATSGYRGICFASSIYAIASLAGYSTANEYMALASTNYASTDLNIVVDTLKPMDGIGTTQTTLSVTNSFGWNIIDNGDCFVKWSIYSSRYELIQTRCT